MFLLCRLSFAGLFTLSWLGFVVGRSPFRVSGLFCTTAIDAVLLTIYFLHVLALVVHVAHLALDH